MIDPDIVIRPVSEADLGAMAALHAAAFGPGRFARTAYRVREAAASGFSLHCHSAWRGVTLAGAVTMTQIVIGEAANHWLLGPLAVSPIESNKGIGRRLVATALASVATHAPPAATVILVGDRPYYGPLGFEGVAPGRITLPGPVDPGRLLIWRGPGGDREVPAGEVRAADA